MVYTKSARFFLVVFALYSMLGAHFFMHNQGGSGLYLPFNMVGWAFVSVLISIGIWHLTIIKQLSFSRALPWYLSGFVILLLPFLNPQAEWNAMAQPRFLAIGAGLLVYFALSQFQFAEKHRHALLYLLLAAVVVEALFGLTQFFLLREGNWIGYNVKINRPYGIFQKDSVFSSFLAAGLAITFYLQRWDEAVQISRWRQALLSIILVVVPLLLVQIQSRAGNYGAMLVVLCMLPVLWFYNRRIFWWSVILLAVGFAMGLVVYTSVRSADSYVLTSGFRKLYWLHLLTMLPQSPWLGHGYGSFEYTFLHDFYAPEHITPGMRLMEENLDHPHNEVLFWLHEGGIVAVIGLMVFATGYICALFKCAGWAKRISLLALVLPLLFHSMVEYPFYHSVAHFFFFIVFLWLADAESGQQKIVACDYWFLARFMAILIPLVVVPFMLTGLQAAYVLTKYDRAKDKNPQVLEQIINPLPWMMMYEFQMRSVQLTFSAAMHDKAGLESYVDWATKFLHNTPRAIVYARLVYALEQLNDKQQAQFWLEEGKRLFPQADFLHKISLSSKPVVSGAQ
ncbi:MAG: Wzy polymerase domain-containing protein [Tolumonas sp.]|nr:Wzy polymerase domain-containing protein [Tolumonas sp.]